MGNQNRVVPLWGARLRGTTQGTVHRTPLVETSFNAQIHPHFDPGLFLSIRHGLPIEIDFQKIWDKSSILTLIATHIDKFAH